MIPTGHNEHYAYNPTHAPADFAYSAVGPGEADGWGKAARPSTGASTLSTTTTESPDAGTPPVTSGGHHGEFGSHEADVNRFTPDFGYVAMNENLPHYGKDLD